MCQIFYRDNGEVMSIEDRVKKIVSDQLGKSLEEEFDLEIADEDAEKISTVNEAVEYVNSNS